MPHKAVIVVSDALPTGLKANVAAVLSMAFGKAHPDLVGPDVTCADGETFAGIVAIPLPILCAPAEALRDLDAAAEALPYRAAYTDAALKTRSYDDYARLLAAAPRDAQPVHGLLLYGPRKAIDRIAGRLPLLR